MHKDIDLNEKMLKGIADILLAKLEELDISQREASKRCGIDFNTFNKYCKGARAMTTLNAFKIFSALGISLSDLILKPCMYEKDWNKVYDAFVKRFTKNGLYLDPYASWSIYSETPQQIRVFTGMNGTVIYDYWKDEFWFE